QKKDDNFHITLLGARLDHGFKGREGCQFLKEMLNFYLRVVIPAAKTQQKSINSNISKIGNILSELKENVQICHRFFNCDLCNCRPSPYIENIYKVYEKKKKENKSEAKRHVGQSGRFLGHGRNPAPNSVNYDIREHLESLYTQLPKSFPVPDTKLNGMRRTFASLDDTILAGLTSGEEDSLEDLPCDTAFKLELPHKHLTDLWLQVGLE
ncbi:hypothetical protein scyTo_0011424, partial [Scyliorhinus torazame]|nr:hypothetical protein [Scyliorhinus torazame]